MFVSIGAVNTDQVAGCDGCGTVAVLALTNYWRRFTGRSQTGMTIDMHHCPNCAQYNENVRCGIVYGVDANTAVSYDD